MHISAFFHNLHSAYQAELDDLRQDSEGRKRMDRAYAMTNPFEYFAESTEAYFSRNDFFPYNRAELLETDPGMCALLAKVWSLEPKAAAK